MIDLLKQELPAHYGLHRSVVEVPAECTDELRFDLADGHDTMIVAYGSGNVSFDRSCRTIVQVIGYEGYLNGWAGTGFERGRLRCDFIVYDAEKNGFFILNEQTSATGSIRNLQKPILDKKTGNVRFPGGKYEKVEAQLIEYSESCSGYRNIHGKICPKGLSDVVYPDVPGGKGRSVGSKAYLHCKVQAGGSP